jgi:hypothetical protein
MRQIDISFPDYFASYLATPYNDGRRKWSPQMVAANGRRTRRSYKWSICVGSWRAATIIVARHDAMQSGMKLIIDIFIA